MSTQADVDALTTTVEQVAADLATTQQALQGEIDALATGNPALNLTALQAAVAPLDATVRALAAVKPTPPTPPAPVAPRSVYTADVGTPIDTNQWTATTEQTTDTPPRPLYNYAGDTAPGDRKGDGLGGVWHLYTGQTRPVPAPPAA